LIDAPNNWRKKKNIPNKTPIVCSRSRYLKHRTANKKLAAIDEEKKKNTKNIVKK
jgi:hypothetical protein